MVDFSKLKANRGQNSKLMKEQLKKQERSFGEDERFWKHTFKKVGDDHISENIIRFLPVSKVDMEKYEKEEIESISPIAKIDKYMFKTQTGKWFVENSITTFAEISPIGEHDAPLWSKWKDNGKPEGPLKKILIGRLPKSDLICNIHVIKDGTVPENNGKTFLYKIPITIKKMMDEAEKPKFEGQKAIDPWDLWDSGANLHLNVVGEEKEFGGQKRISPDFKNVTWSNHCEIGDDDLKQKVWEESYSTNDFYDRKNFKSYDELKNKFYKLMYGDMAEQKMKEIDGGETPVVKKETIKSDPEPKKENDSMPPKNGEDSVESKPDPKSESTNTDSDLDDFESMLNS